MKKIDKLWEQAEQTGEKIDIGDLVLCDFCSEDYTDKPDTGGFIFGSKAVCPKCADRLLPDIVKYGEAHYIKAECPLGTSFADFVREYRGENNYIQVIKE